MSATPKQPSFLEVVKDSDDFPYGPAAERYYQLFLPNDELPHGYMLPEIVAKMPWTSNFRIRHEHPHSVTVLDSSNGASTANAINTAFQEVVDQSINKFDVLDGRHSEKFALVGARYDSPVWIERYATTLFGLTTRGAHLVAYTNTDQGMKIWISRRAPHLYTYPNMLDSTVAGGVKAEVPPFQTIVEESDEEASLPEDLIRQHTRSRGVLTHMSVTGKGFRGEKGLVNPDYIYIYDIELPSDVVPKPHDDEVSNFYCMTVQEVKQALLNGEFKPDSGAVLIDFFIRNNIITSENEPNFVEISMRLHRWLPFRVG